MAKYARIRLSGGLGNQLFKFLAGLEFARKTDTSLEVDLAWFNKRKQVSDKVSHRQLALDYFPRVKEFIEDSSVQDFSDATYKILKAISRINQRSAFCFGYVNEKYIHNYSVSRNRSNYLDGNFEDWTLLPNDDSLKKLLSFPESKTTWFKNTEKELLSEDFLIVHVRRGDYLNLPEIYEVLTPKYYANSISYLKEKYGKSKVVLFSDDPNSALAWLQKSIVFDEIITPPADVSPGEVLRAMSLGKGIVTAHSTFSWWAAKIGTLNETTLEVVLPREYFADSLNRNNLWVPSWKVFDVR